MHATKTFGDEIGKDKENVINTPRIYVHNATCIMQGPKANEAYWAKVARFSFLINVATQIVNLFLVMDDVAKVLNASVCSHSAVWPFSKEFHYVKGV